MQFKVWYQAAADRVGKFYPPQHETLASAVARARKIAMKNPGDHVAVMRGASLYWSSDIGFLHEKDDKKPIRVRGSTGPRPKEGRASTFKVP